MTVATQITLVWSLCQPMLFLPHEVTELKPQFRAIKSHTQMHMGTHTLTGEPGRSYSQLLQIIAM